MTVPFLDVGDAYRELRPGLDESFARVLSSGWYIGGEEVEAFERAFAGFCDVAHVVGVGNGLDALTIALRARGIGVGDEVIVPAHTFIATWLAVSRAGATIVPVDVNEDDLLIDVAAVATAVTARTAAILPVHLYGAPVDIDPLLALAGRHGLFLLGDAAQAHGARRDGRDVGALGDAAAYSFYPAKNLGAFGDGGALTTDDAALADRARRLRNYGAADHYRFAELGVNSRLDPIQAAVLRVKLEVLEEWNLRRRAIATAYQRALGEASELTLPPAPAHGIDPVWHLFCVRHPRRDALAQHLGRAGVATQIHYPEPPHLSAAYEHLGYERGAFPVTERAAQTLLSLPIGPHLAREAADVVIDSVLGFSA